MVVEQPKVPEIRWLPDDVPPRTKRREETQDELWEEDNVSRVSALIRESIQNSLDEVFDPHKPVQVTFSLGMQTEKLNRKYFNELFPHVCASSSLDSDTFDRDSPYLLIEDFNTLGMEGSTREVKPTLRVLEDKSVGANSGGHKESFWNFTWVSGSTSKKKGTNRGSRGVGKIVFPINSEIRAYLVYSSRRIEASPDGDPQILFGHSLLSYHDLEGREFKPDIYWMVEADEKSRITIPSCDKNEISDFISDWHLRRSHQEFGSSILIPYCDATFTGNRIAQTIIRDYFVEILSGKLICSIDTHTESSIEINRDSLIGLIGELDEDLRNDVTKSANELKLICQMYLDYLDGSPEKIELLKIPSVSGHKNDWAQISIDADVQTAILSSLENGKTIVFEVAAVVPRSIRDKIQEPESTNTFEVLIKQEDEIVSTTIFTREGILIPAANKKSLLQDAISLLAVDTSKSGRLANFLRSSEGAAHDKWRHDAKNIKDIYSPDKDVKRLLDFIKMSPEKLWRLTQKSEDAIEDEGLSKYFPVTDENNNSRSGVGGIKPGPDPVDEKKRVLLTGSRLGEDGVKAKIRWNPININQDSFEIYDLGKNAPAIVVGALDRNFLLEGLLSHQTYDLMVRVTENDQIFDSNTIKLLPLEPPTVSNFARKVESGFEISSNHLALPVGTKLKIQVAYRSRGSKSLEKWTLEDFDLRALLGNHHGLIIVHNGNRIAVEVEKTDFAAVWQGFDPLRDLLIESDLERS